MGKKRQGRLHKGFDEIVKAVLVGKYSLCEVSLDSQGTYESPDRRRDEPALLAAYCDFQ